MKVSIITVNLNNRVGLEKTILSVIGQKYKMFEYIVIDGGSEDGSLDIINRYQTNINVWDSSSDSGVYNAMNKGIERASGEYCYFLNSGDYLVSDTVLENVFNLNLNEDIIYGDMVREDNHKTEHGKKDMTFFDFFKGSIFHQAAFIKRELFKTFGNYNESLKVVSDWEFFIKVIFLHNRSLRYLNISIAIYSPGGLSFQNLSNNLKERRSVLDRYFPLFIKDYQELNVFKDSEFSGIYRELENNKVIAFLPKQILKAFRFLKFKILRRDY